MGWQLIRRLTAYEKVMKLHRIIAQSGHRMNKLFVRLNKLLGFYDVDYMRHAVSSTSGHHLSGVRQRNSNRSIDRQKTNYNDRKHGLKATKYFY